jgi:hypothetical protein
MVMVALVVVAVAGTSLSRRNDLKRCRIMGMDAAITVREDSLKPQMIKGRALSVYREGGRLGISRENEWGEEGLTAEVPAVEDWGDGGHFHYRRDPGTGEVC